MMIHTLSTSQLWHLAGWTMIHYLWIGGLIGAATLMLRFPIRRRTPALRYALTLACFFALAAAPVGIAMWLANEPQFAAAVSPNLAEVSPAAEALQSDAAKTQAFGDSNVQAEPTSQVIDLAETPLDADSLEASFVQRELAPQPNTIAFDPALASPPAETPQQTSAFDFHSLLASVTAIAPWIWIGGAPLTFLLLASGLIGADRLRRSASVMTSGTVFDLTERLRQAAGVSRQVTVAVSDRVLQPVLVGIVRPLILLPPAAINGWSPAQLEMALLHELTHVRRWDNFVNLVQRVVESLLFFQPAVWMVSRWLRADREQCCDAAVVRHTGEPAAYAELLVSVAQTAKTQASRSNLSPAFVSAMAQHPLAARIRRILQLEDDPMLVSRSTFGVASLLLAAVLGMLLWQPAPDTVAQESGEEIIELKKESRVVPDPGRARDDLISDDTEEELTTEDTAGTENKFVVWVQIADDPQVFASPGAAKAWQETQRAIVKSHVVLDQAMRELIEQHKQDTSLAACPPESWLMRELDVQYSQKGVRISLSSRDKPKKELKRLVQAVAKSYTQFRTQHEQEAAGRVRGALESVDSPFLPLDQQRIADLVYKMLKVEIAPLDKKLLPAVREKRFAGGVMIESGANGGRGFGEMGGGPFFNGDIIVGLHVWPTANFDQLAEVLRRDDLMEFSPLKYYVLRPIPPPPTARGGSMGRGGRGGGEMGMGGEFGGRRGGGEMDGGSSGGRGGFGGMESSSEAEDKDFGGEFGGTGGFGGDSFGGGRGGFGGRAGESGRGGGFGMPETIEEKPAEAETPQYELITGRISIPQEEWRNEQARLEREREQRNHATPAASPVDIPSALLRHKQLLKQREQAVERDLQRERERQRESNSQDKTLLYDGRTFDDWSSQWKNELKVEKRTEAIKALAAFGRAGDGERAAKAILDVAAEYDYQRSTNSERELLQHIDNALAKNIPAADWFSLLENLYNENPGQWSWLAGRLVPTIRDPELRQSQTDWLLKIVNSDDQSSRNRCFSYLVSVDQWQRDPRILKVVGQALESATDNTQLMAIHAALSPEAPEPLTEQVLRLATRGPEHTKRQIRSTLDSRSGNPGADAILSSLIEMLESSEHQEVQLEVIRAIGAFGSGAKSAKSELEKLIESNDAEVQVAAAAALARFRSNGRSQAYTLLIEARELERTRENVTGLANLVRREIEIMQGK